MTRPNPRRVINVLLALAFLVLVLTILWPSRAAAQEQPPTGATLLIVPPERRAVTAADLELVRGEVASATRLIYGLYMGTFLVLGAMLVAANGGRLRLTAGPVTVETGGPPDAPPAR